MENFLFQLPHFYVPRSIFSFIEQHGTNTTAGDEVLKKLWSTEGGARLCLKSTISHVGKKVVKELQYIKDSQFGQKHGKLRSSSTLKRHFQRWFDFKVLTSNRSFFQIVGFRIPQNP